MARGRVQMKRIENPVHRQVTFCKRRAGLLKKARELSVLCDAEIGVVIFSAHGKLYELATKGTMQGLIERYTNYNGGTPPDEAIAEPIEAKKEIDMLKQEIEILQKGLRYMFGGGSEIMTLDELVVLEKHLEIWIYHIRSAKMDILFQEIQMLRNKEGILNAANKYLQDKIEENSSNTDFTTINTNMPHPLTVANNIF
ncbi:PREDICTED: agamous-like MADS-box protein AGL12 [Theobroma cacao]|uniref:Agamous-like MADS-box protein AGL12 n=1 Tax=Theobroma cacao TaxID=3641 RepID=A0AB32WSF3_THECC|nr:PREDICTED: agamous-like MADS-box protein AGL12 [Theobroma cacao]